MSKRHEPAMRVIVCGSRDYVPDNDFYITLTQEILKADLFYGTRVVTVVHGGCPTGADAAVGSLVEGYEGPAELIEEVHMADWDTHGKAAGPIRNRKMAALGATVCHAFWDGKSRGTRDMIAQATAHGIPVHIHPPRKMGLH